MKSQEINQCEKNTLYHSLEIDDNIYSISWIQIMIVTTVHILPPKPDQKTLKIFQYLDA